MGSQAAGLVLMSLLLVAGPASGETVHRTTLAGRSVALPVGDGLCAFDPNSRVGGFLNARSRRSGNRQFLVAGLTCRVAPTLDTVRDGQADVLVWYVHMPDGGQPAPRAQTPTDFMAGFVREVIFLRAGTVLERRMTDDGQELVIRHRSFWQDDNGAYLNVRAEFAGVQDRAEICGSVGTALIRQFHLSVTSYGGCDETARNRNLGQVRAHMARAAALNP